MTKWLASLQLVQRQPFIQQTVEPGTRAAVMTELNAWIQYVAEAQRGIDDQIKTATVGQIVKLGSQRAALKTCAELAAAILNELNNPNTDLGRYKLALRSGVIQAISVYEAPTLGGLQSTRIKYLVRNPRGLHVTPEAAQSQGATASLIVRAVLESLAQGHGGRVTLHAENHAVLARYQALGFVEDLAAARGGMVLTPTAARAFLQQHAATTDRNSLPENLRVQLQAVVGVAH